MGDQSLSLLLSRHSPFQVNKINVYFKGLFKEFNVTVHGIRGTVPGNYMSVVRKMAVTSSLVRTLIETGDIK